MKNICLFAFFESIRLFIKNKCINLSLNNQISNRIYDFINNH